MCFGYVYWNLRLASKDVAFTLKLLWYIAGCGVAYILRNFRDVCLTCFRRFRNSELLILSKVSEKIHRIPLSSTPCGHVAIEYFA